MDGIKDIPSNISGKLKIKSNQKALKLIRKIRLKKIKQLLPLKKKKSIRGLKIAVKSKIQSYDVPRA